MTGVAFQVLASLGVVAVVLFAMWRLPKASDTALVWAPSLALMSVWCGLFGVIGTACLWWVRTPDAWLPALLLVLLPGAVAGGVLVIWIYRKFEGDEALMKTAEMQRLQARIGVTLGLLATAIGYSFVLLHKAPLTHVGQ
jgi:hypothetical protein